MDEERQNLDNECAICGHDIGFESSALLDGDRCHLNCALEAQDAIGFDSDFGASC